MEIKPIKKSFPFLLILATGFLIFGLGKAYLDTRFSPLTTILSLAGLLSFLGSLCIVLFPSYKSFSYAQWLKHVLGIMAVVVLVIGLISINYLASQYDFRFDVTRMKQHTLSPTTLTLIKNLRQDVTMTAFHVGIPPQYLEDMFKEYAHLASGRIKTEVIDPLVQIGYAAQFGNVISGDEKKVIVQSGKERRDIDFKEKPLSKAFLTNAIIKVTREKRKVYFLTGHKENDLNDTSPSGYSILKNSLEGANSETKNLLLTDQNTVPPDCDVLVVAGAQNPLSEKEEETIQNYLEKGGKALFLIESVPVFDATHPLSEADKKKNPSLNSILEKWCLKIGDDIVVDTENYAGADVGCPVTKNYPKHKEIISGLDYTFYIRPRSISMASQCPEDVKIAPLVYTASKINSWAETDRSLHVKFDEGTDIKGPISIAAVVWEPKNEKKPADTKIIVFTDADFATNQFIGQYSNGEIILNSLNWLSELDNIIPLEEKPAEVTQLNLTSKDRRLVTIFLVTMPMLIIAAGFLVWWQKTCHTRA